MILSGYSYRQKMKGLFICLGSFLFLSYQLSIKKTINEFKKCSTLTAMAINGSQPETGLPTLTARYKKLSVEISNYRLDTFDLSKNLLGIVSQYCNSHDLLIKEYKPLGVNMRDNIEVFTRYIVVEGNFKDCLDLVYQLENHENAGRLVSVNFKSYEDKKEGVTKLNCIIYVQNIL